MDLSFNSTFFFLVVGNSKKKLKIQKNNNHNNNKAVCNESSRNLTDAEHLIFNLNLRENPEADLTPILDSELLTFSKVILFLFFSFSYIVIIAK